MTLAGVKPLDILSTIRQTNEGALVNLSTLYNGRANVLKDLLHGRTPIQALFDDLQASKFLHFHRYDENGMITSLFFAHKESVRLARQYHHVALMDCTYKTNKYRLPLLHIVGMTSFNSHFSVGFCFLKEEKQSDYTWALSKLATIWTPETRPGLIVTDRELALMAAIDKVFSSSSHLLCIWHTNKNILAKCKRQFETSEEWTVFLQQWCILVAANTELEYEKQWKELSDSFKTKPKYRHFGNKATSRVEGAHAYIKKFLQDRTEVTRHSEDNLRYLNGLPSIYTPECGMISAFAIKKCLEEFKRKTEERGGCTMVFTSTIGIPCAHKLKKIENSGSTLTKIDFHEQWNLDWRHDAMDANDETGAVNVKWTVLENKLKELPGDQQKVLLAQMTQLVEGHSTVVEMRAPEIQTETRGRPP
uniref:Pc21g00130 putative n=1 Tax=Albugo laibachii Nc14 TaxID=890382 RepID=F0WAA2_9STRA|nr:Pc21g00130 putative [Albugo laibachii Nc14]|eukprot:CCA18072.1 Pc21g00130 putative [Albugo laibachii Nc14]